MPATKFGRLGFDLVPADKLCIKMNRRKRSAAYFSQGRNFTVVGCSTLIHKHLVG